MNAVQVTGALFTDGKKKSNENDLNKVRVIDDYIQSPINILLIMNT